MNSASGPRILISAGEPSADQHGAAVVKALRSARPDLDIEAIGGPKIAAAGARLRFDLAKLSAVGLIEILGSLPRHHRLLAELNRDFQAGRYDLVVLLDYPGFHLRVAESAKRAALPVLYYIAPQLWAWRPGRIRRLIRGIDRLAVILPFERAYFAARGIATDYVGHPLLDRTDVPDRSSGRRQLGLAENETVLGIFPGSRSREIDSHWPLFRAIAQRLLQEGCCQRAVVAATPGGAYPDPGEILVHRGDPAAVFAAADAAVAKSGTTTLEAALAAVPMAVVYRPAWLTAQIAPRLLTVEWISLVNLIADRAVVPEFWHWPVKVTAVTDAVRPLLRGGAERAAQLEGLELVRSRLGPSGAAERVANIALELLRQ